MIRAMMLASLADEWKRRASQEHAVHATIGWCQGELCGDHTLQIEPSC